LRLFTFLGTGVYKEALYTWPGVDDPVRTCYSPVATARFLKVDAVTAFLTLEAETTHLAGLKSALPANTPLHTVRIPSGKNEDEFWDIFQLLSTEAAAEQNQVWDVTHGFRSLPLITMLALAFLRSGLEVRPEHIIYGLFDKENQPAPLIDLAPMLSLLDWAGATERFNQTGDARGISMLLTIIKDDFMRSSELSQKERYFISPVTHLTGRLKDLSSALALIRPPSVSKNAHVLTSEIHQVREVLTFSARTRPAAMLLDRVKETYAPLAGESDLPKETLKTQLSLIQWYVERELWMQAATLEREWMISWVMFQQDESAFLVDKDARERTAKILNLEANNAIEAKSVVNDLSKIHSVKELLKVWKNLGDIRNDLDHAGMRERPKPPETIVTIIRETAAKLDGFTH